MEENREETELRFLLQCARASQRYTRKVITLEYRDKQMKNCTDCIFIRELPVAAGWVGCAIWDAAVIMSRYFSQNPDVFYGRRLLELGSGTGLTGIVAARYAKEVILTDYSTPILENLEYNIWLNAGDLSDEKLTDLFGSNEETKHLYRKNNECMRRAVSVAYLNWFDPASEEKPATSLESDTASRLPPNNFRCRIPGGLSLRKFSLIFGSELTYQMPGVEELASVIELFLEPGGVFWEILSIFRGPGPKKFMLLMEERGWTVEARKPSDDLLQKLDSKQSKSRDEKYLLWTLFRKQDASDTLPRFGTGPAIDWHTLQFTSDHH